MSQAGNIRFWEYNFLSPEWLWLLVLLPLLIGLKFLVRGDNHATIKFTRNSATLTAIESPIIKWIIIGLQILMFLGLTILIFGMAKPYHPAVENDDEKEYSEGIDIIIALDISGSMMITDFLPYRLEAAKDVAKEFIDGRKNDKIGLVVYEGEAYTACPATRNHAFLKSCLDKVESGWLEPGTAIGTGLGTAVTRLRSDSLTSKVIILLTDGESNKGELTPLAAAELAKNKDVRVYTIGVGKDGYANMPIQTIFGQTTTSTYVSIDEKTLKKIAKLTNGAYFRATDKNSLREIYKTIEKMETRKMIENTYHKDPPLSPLAFILYGLVFILLSWSTQYLIFRKVG